MHTLPKSAPEDPERIIELDMDNTMYLMIEFPGNKDVIWKSLVRQADKCFTFLRTSGPSDGSGCIERCYENASKLSHGVTIANDYSMGTISIQIRTPQSAKAIDMFANYPAMISGCCDAMSEIVRAALADCDLEDVFDEFRV